MAHRAQSSCLFTRLPLPSRIFRPQRVQVMGGSWAVFLRLWPETDRPLIHAPGRRLSGGLDGRWRTAWVKDAA
jgi:hypothetical protein